MKSRASAGVTPAELALYFLRLGALGFGGPVALAEAMRRELVERRGWLSEEEYDAGLAIAAACPGPLAYQLGVYCGYIRCGVRGALAVAVTFALVPFLLVVAAAAAYTRFAASEPVRALFYGVGPVVVALIFRASWRLGKKTLRRDASAWAMAVIACIITFATQKELTAIFVVAGCAGIFLFREPAGSTAGAPLEKAKVPSRGSAGGLFFLPGLLTVSSGTSVAALFLFFFETGCLVFGSGLVIVPFLKAYVVGELGWLDDREFLDAVAMGMISPGPVVITATFVGYLVAGARGALAATIGMFTPAILFTIVATPLFLRHGRSVWIRGFVRGVTVTVVGVLLGTTLLVTPVAVVDVPTAVVAAAALSLLAFLPRVPEPLLVVAGALLGLGLSLAS